MTVPPGNSLDHDQAGRVFDPGESPLDALEAILERTRDEIDYNASKGDGAYRLGVHDGLRYAEDAVIAALKRFGRTVAVVDREGDV